jgi:hypothetical protein
VEGDVRRGLGQVVGRHPVHPVAVLAQERRPLRWD